ncbi:MFS transporter [Pseudomonas chlororaphis]|uniref:MFS transporter n=1 Tax=Pseudomonas chlororaphis TaxID=587753 RepID=A0AB34C5T7_9PSED|nr:MFS transporter [Pseudomonas chlororaphis]KAA5842473.1 MFS transporter [Pseudomonas chlororaphis]
MSTTDYLASPSGMETIGGSVAPCEALRTTKGTINPGWKTAFASLVGLTLGPSCMLAFCFGVFIPELEKAFGWSIGAISLGAMLINIMIVIATFLAGAVVDRIGARLVVLCSIPAFSISISCFYFLSSDIRLFYCLIVVSCLAGLGTWPLAYNRATAVWFDRRLGLALGISNVGIGLGAALLPLLLSFLIPLYGWKSGYLVLGLLAILIPWPIAYFMLKELIPGNARNLTQNALYPAKGLTFRAARKERSFWLILSGFFMLGIAAYSIVVHMVRILLDQGMTTPMAAAMQSVFGITLIFGRILTGWILDHLSSTVVSVAISLIAAASIFLLGMDVPIWVAVVSIALFGFVIGAELDVLSYLVVRHFGPRAFGSIYAAAFAAFQIASALSVGLLGWWRQSNGSYDSGLFCIAAILILGAAIFSRLKAPKHN